MGGTPSAAEAIVAHDNNLSPRIRGLHGFIGLFTAERVVWYLTAELLVGWVPGYDPGPGCPTRAKCRTETDHLRKPIA